MFSETGECPWCHQNNPPASQRHHYTSHRRDSSLNMSILPVQDGICVLEKTHTCTPPQHGARKQSPCLFTWWQGCSEKWRCAHGWFPSSGWGSTWVWVNLSWAWWSWSRPPCSCVYVPQALGAQCWSRQWPRRQQGHVGKVRGWPRSTRSTRPAESRRSPPRLQQQ